MLKVLISTIVLIIILFSAVWVLKISRNKAKRIMSNTDEESNWGTCKKCGERRIIIKEGLCAFCWSSSQTKGAI